MEQIHKILKEIWGYSSFRLVQEDIIKSILEGKDTLGLMPTGGGKSITFQVPALVREGTCLVVTPLIALMTDQVEKLQEKGIKAEALHAGLEYREARTKLESASNNAYKFLYVSPERLQVDFFREKLKHMNINMLVVDEAHCISQWGYDFRPSYLEIVSVREIIGDAPVLALTATATPDVVEDIQHKLNFKKKNVFSSDFARENLVYFVRNSEGKLTDLLRLLQSIKGTAVVYVRNRKKTREIAQYLNQNKIVADFYHAGLSYELRQHKQQQWIKENIRVMVATNAFGMGIDKDNVRLVVHVDLPDFPEAYFQEAGRAGRDGKKAFAVLLTQKNDKATAASRLATSFPELPKILRIYEAVCNYLKVPIGAGKGSAYDFSLHDFCAVFKFNSLEVFNSLKILEQQGYIQLTDELRNPSRLRFILHRDDLYKFQIENYKFDGFIKLLLRSYTGLFSEYTIIDEELLARRANITRQTIYEYLTRLSSLKVLHYIPSRKTPLVIFLMERLEQRSVYISKENYTDRKKRYEERMNAMLAYAFENNECRSVRLLKYFGQKDGKPCGQCDVCKSGYVSQEYQQEQLQTQILELLQQEPLFPDEIQQKLGTPDTTMLKTVYEDLLDKQIIAYNKERKLYITNTK